MRLPPKRWELGCEVRSGAMGPARESEVLEGKRRRFMVEPTSLKITDIHLHHLNPRLTCLDGRKGLGSHSIQLVPRLVHFFFSPSLTRDHDHYLSLLDFINPIE